MAIVQDRIETASQSNDYLMQFLMCMSPAHRASRGIVQVINAPDLEWDVAALLNKRQIATRI